MSFLESSLGDRPFGSHSSEPAAAPGGSLQSGPGCVGLECEPGQPIVRTIQLGSDASRLAGVLADVGLQCINYSSMEAFRAGDSTHDPGCVVLDADSLFSAVEGEQGRLRRSPCGCHPMIVTAKEPPVCVAVQAMKAGAVDFLERPFDPSAMLQAISLALEVDRKRRVAERRHGDLRAHFATLTPRERQVIALVTAGRLNKQIAFDLGLSEITVKVHRGSVMRKMHARSLAELVRMADAMRDLASQDDL